MCIKTGQAPAIGLVLHTTGTETGRRVVSITADVAHPKRTGFRRCFFTMILTVSLFSLSFLSCFSDPPAAGMDPICSCNSDHIIYFYWHFWAYSFFFFIFLSGTWMKGRGLLLLQCRYVATTKFFFFVVYFGGGARFFLNFGFGFWLCFSRLFYIVLAIDRRRSARVPYTIYIFFIIIIIILSRLLLFGADFLSSP